MCNIFVNIVSNAAASERVAHAAPARAEMPLPRGQPCQQSQCRAMRHCRYIPQVPRAARRCAYRRFAAVPRLRGAGHWCRHVASQRQTKTEMLTITVAGVLISAASHRSIWTVERPCARRAIVPLRPDHKPRWQHGVNAVCPALGFHQSGLVLNLR